MLPVYICEDDEAVRAAQEEFLRKLILMEGYDMELALCTGHPEDVLLAAERHPKRGVYFLDVELKGEQMDGFLLGKRLRALDPRGFLIYVTAFSDLAFETFRYHLEALDYIVKGDPEQMKQGMRQGLATVVERMQREKGEERAYFSVKVMDVVKHIPIDEIMFFETSGRTHRIELHGVHDRIDFIGSMQELQEQLGDGFFRAHRACLVNVRRIAELDLKHREILMQNGERCFFSKNVKGKLLDLF